MVARHNCVVLPGLGALLAQEIPAFYNAADGVFIPPHRTLGFNPQLITDDALLLTEYMGGGKLSYMEAGMALDRDMATLRKKLSATGVLHFGELGVFSMNINGEISFTPCENGIDDIENFGFEPLLMPLLSKCEEKVIVIPRRSLSRYIAVAAAVVLAFFVVTPMSDSAYKPSMQAGFIPANSVEQHTATDIADVCEIAPVENTVTENIITDNFIAETAPEEIVTEPVEVTVVETVAATEEVIETPAITEEPATVIENMFHIIVASSPNADNAQLAIKELSRKKSADYTVVVCGKRHRISIGSYPSNNEATEALEQVKSTFPDAWVLSLE